MTIFFKIAKQRLPIHLQYSTDTSSIICKVEIYFKDLTCFFCLQIPGDRYGVHDLDNCQFCKDGSFIDYSLFIELF